MNRKVSAVGFMILFAFTITLLWSISAIAQPVNNNYASATEVSSLINTCSANAAYTTISATGDKSAGSCWSNGPNYNVWFSFTATTTGYIKVQVKTGGSEGTMQYPMVALWDSTGSGQITCMNQNGQYTDIELNYYGLTQGVVYYISVDNFSGTNYRGTFKLCLSDVPDNDYYEGATNVTSLINTCSADGAYTTMFGSADKNSGTCWSNGPNYNRWFKFTASSTGYIKVQAKTGGSEGTVQYPMLALWASNGTTQLACMNQNGQYTDIELDYYGLTPGNIYYISVDNYSGTGYRGTFKLCLNDVADNNYYEGATDISSLINTCSADAAYTTLFASPDKNSGSCWSNGPNYNRWYKFTATTTGYMKVQVKTGGSEGTIQYPMVALWASNGTTQLACMNQNGQYADIELDYYGLTSGNTYYISVDNYVGTGYRGTFKLCLSDVADNNYYEGATNVSSLINTCSADAAYTTLYANSDKSAGSCWSNGPNYNRWYKFTATTTGYMKVQVKTGGSEGTIQYPMVALWASNGTTQLACMNQNGQYADIELDYYGLTSGNTYYISVDNYVGTGYRGTFKLCLSDVADNNYYEGANDVTSLINGCSANGAYSTLYATADKSSGSCWSNGPNYNRWFKFTASSTGYMKVQVNTGGSEGTLQYPMVALWASNGSTQLTCVNQNGQYTDVELDYVSLTPGNTYYISVDNYVGTGYRGTFTLCLSDQKDYNYYEGATTLTDLNNWCSADGAYTTSNATADKNTGSCWSNGPNYNRWFKFTALYSGVTIQVKTGGSEGTVQYPMVALWSSNGTTQLGCTNQSGQNTDLTLSYASLTVGNTYYISVDNYAGTGYRGTFKLCVNNVAPTTYYSRGDGDWSDPNTWSTTGLGGSAASSVPATGNVVFIQDKNIVITSAIQCADLNIATSTAATSVTVNNATLTVNGNLNLTNAANNSAKITVQNNGIIAVANNAIITRSGGNTAARIDITRGTMTVGQDMTWVSTGGTTEDNILTLDSTSSLSIGRDLTQNSTGGRKISFTFGSTSTLTVGRDFIYTAAAAGMTESVFNNSSAMRIKRNIVRGSTPYGMLTFNGSSTLTFNGSSYQQIMPASAGSGGDAITYNNVVFNNISGYATDITMGGVAVINGGMTMTSGIIQTSSSNYIYLMDAGTTTVGNASCYIDGPMQYELASATAGAVRNFPIGKGTYYRPASLTLTHSDNTSVTYTAEVMNTAASSLGFTLAPSTDKVSGVRYWQIDRQSVSNLTTASVRLYYGTDDGVNDYTNLTVVKTIGSGTTWNDIGGTATGNNSGSITSGSFSSFSKFTLGNLGGGTNTLPVKLVSFAAELKGEVVALNWTTASEQNNDFFTIERSADGLQFETVSMVDGAGNSSHVLNYTAVDIKPYPGTSYYRIRQTDFDGRFTYSKIVAVENNKAATRFRVFPNPASNGNIHLALTSNPGDHITIYLNDLFGKTVFVSSKVVGGDQVINIGKDIVLSAGIYVMTVENGTSRETQKIVIK